MTEEHIPEITPEILDKLIKLAQFELTPERKAYLREELNKQRQALEKVDEAITQIESEGLLDDLKMMTHGTAFNDKNRSPLREDTPQPFENVEDILENAPQINERYFVVPRHHSPESKKSG